MRKHLLILQSFSAISTLSLAAANYTSNFTGLTAGATLNGVDGWVGSDPTEDPQAPWAFGTSIDLDTTNTAPNLVPAAAVSGYYNTDTPLSGEFHVTHTLDLTTGMLFDMNFAIVDSEGFDVEGTIYGAERNSFRIGFNNSVGTEVFGLLFDPVPIQNNLPGDPGNSWNVTSTSPGYTFAPSMRIFDSQLYALNLSLLPDAGDLKFSYSLDGSTTLGSSGTLTGLASGEIITEVQFGINNLNGQFGTNQLVFEGVQVSVPETSSVLLTGLAVAGFAFRRKRTAD